MRLMLLSAAMMASASLGFTGAQTSIAAKARDVVEIAGGDGRKRFHSRGSARHHSTTWHRMNGARECARRRRQMYGDDRWPRI